MPVHTLTKITQRNVLRYKQALPSGEWGVPLIALVCTFLVVLTSQNTDLQLTRFSLSVHL